MMNSPHRVVKLGGSLLDWNGLKRQLMAWLGSQPTAQNVLIVGGGKFADLIRDANRTHHLGEASTHWLCVRQMSVTAKLLATLLPHIRLITELEELPDAPTMDANVILDTHSFLVGHQGCKSVDRLPKNDDVSSDSIAAQVAIAVNSPEFVLIKSARPPSDRIEELVATGYLDQHFAKLLPRLPPVRTVALRVTGHPSVTLRHGP